MRRPTGFGDGNEAREGEVLHHIGRGHVFGPECALHTDRVLEVGGLFFVSGFQVVGTVAGQRGHPPLFRGGAVDVIRAVDGVDAGESEFVGDLGTAACGHPAIDRGAGFLHELEVGTFLGHGFVPNGDFATFRTEVGADFVDEVGLQLAIRRELQALVHLLALLVVLPCRGGAFVTANVDILRGENVHQFVENVLHKAHGFGIGHVEHVGEHPTPRFHAVRAIRIAGELRVGGHGCREVAGHVDLGNHLDVAFGGVGDDVFQLSARVEVGAVGTICPVGAVLHGGDIGVRRHGTDRGQPRIFFHFPTPTLVFGEVEVELVEFVHRHEVEHAFNLVDAEKVAGHVEHEAAIGEARAVGDGQAGQFVACDGRVVHTGGDAGGQHLVETGESVEEAGGGGGFDRHAFGLHGQAVAFLAEGVRRVLHLAERDDGARGAGGDGGRVTAHFVEVADEFAYFCAHRVVETITAHRESCGEDEGAGLNAHLFGKGRQVDKRLLRIHFAERQ